MRTSEFLFTDLLIPSRQLRPNADLNVDVPGPTITLYGGRKGFTGLMSKRGHSKGNISRWLGHMSLNRTYQDYTERLKTNFEDYDDAG